MVDENYFDGEHNECYGNKWAAISENSEQFFTDIIGDCVQNGELLYVQEYDNKKYAAIIYPETSPISMLSLIEITEEANVFASAYPVLQGLDNKIKLKDTYAWEIEAEGEMAGELETNDKLILNFHNPYFVKDIQDFKFNNIQNVAFAGLAYSIERLEEQEFVIKEGSTYEFFLKKFLEENPDKTEADFEPPVHRIDADYFRMFISKKYTSLYEAAGQIKDISHTNIFDKKITILKVNFGHDEENEEFLCNVYVSEHVLKDYVPKINDGIVCIMWLCGYFN